MSLKTIVQNDHLCSLTRALCSIENTFPSMRAGADAHGWLRRSHSPILCSATETDGLDPSGPGPNLLMHFPSLQNGKRKGTSQQEWLVVRVDCFLLPIKRLNPTEKSPISMIPLEGSLL